MARLIKNMSDNILKIMAWDILCLFAVIVLPFEMEFKEDGISFLLHVLLVCAVAFPISEHYTSERNRNYPDDKKSK